MGSGDDMDTTVVEEALERLCVALGGKLMSPLLGQTITQLFTSPNPLHILSAIKLLNRYMEGCTAFIKKSGSPAFILNHFQQGLQLSQRDAAYRERIIFQCLQGIGRYVKVFPEQVDACVPVMTPVVVQLLATSQDTQHCERVRGHAINCLINLLHSDTLSEDDSTASAFLSQHIDTILNAVLLTLRTSSPEVQTPCLVLIG